MYPTISKYDDGWLLEAEVRKKPHTVIDTVIENELKEPDLVYSGKDCKNCFSPMAEFERYYDLCKDCATQRGMLRGCDTGSKK